VGTNPESVTTPFFAATAMSLAEVIVGSQLSSRRTSSRMELSVLACVVVAIIRLSKFHRGRSVCELTARKQNKVSGQGKLSTELGGITTISILSASIHIPLIRILKSFLMKFPTKLSISKEIVALDLNI
jgi:hypothetical protein